MEWTFTGAWSGAVDNVLPSPVYPDRIPIRFGPATVGIGEYVPCLQKIEIDTGNTVTLRECQNASDGSGYRGGIVTDRKVTGSLNPEATLVADYDPHGDWQTATPQSLDIEFSDADDKVIIGVPRMQLAGVAEGDRSGIRTDELSWKANRNQTADDEIFIEFAAAASEPTP